MVSKAFSNQQNGEKRIRHSILNEQNHEENYENDLKFFLSTNLKSSQRI